MNATPHAAPATCRIDGCTAQPCEPGSADNRWARNLCAAHVDAAFQCGGCDRWLPDTEYASGPCDGEEPTCESCYSDHECDRAYGDTYRNRQMLAHYAGEGRS